MQVARRLLLDALRAGARRPRLRALRAPEALRRGGPGRARGSVVARDRGPHPGARRPATIPDVAYEPGRERLAAVTRPRLFGMPYAVAQPRLCALDALGEAGWLKALRLEGYASRGPRRPQALQEALFPYAEALELRPDARGSPPAGFTRRFAPRAAPARRRASRTPAAPPPRSTPRARRAHPGRATR